MTTTLKKALDALYLLNELSNTRMKSTATSRKLFNLKMVVKPALEFCNEEEKKIVEDLGGTIEEDGTVQFKEPEKDIEKFKDARKNLWDSDWEIQLDIPVVFHDDEGVEVSGNDIELLQELGLAKFEE